MEYGKTKLIDMLTNVPREGWSRQKVKDMVDTLWRNPIFLRWSGFEFAGGTDCNISFNEATRVFTIAPKINVFTYYQYRNKLTYHVMNKAYEVEIPNTQGLHVMYFDADPETKTQVLLTTMPDNEKIEEIYLYKVVVAWIYWIPEDPILEIPGQAIYFGDSRHGSEWPNQVHWWNHRTANSERESGLTITDTKADRDGSENDHAQFGITPGSVFHSDIRSEIDGSSPASIPICYIAGGVPKIVNQSGYCFYLHGSICYNNGSAPSPAQEGYYVMYHLFATNCTINPLISAMGLAEYESIGDAKKAMQYEIDTIRHTFPHSNLMLIDTVIFQTSEFYENSVKVRLVADSDERICLVDVEDGSYFDGPGYLDKDYFSVTEVNGRKIFAPQIHIPIITQLGHGFSVGTVIRQSGSTYVAAQADNDTNAQACGIVIEVIDPDNFRFVADGFVPGEWSPGAEYFLSPDTAGLLVTLPEEESWTEGQVRLSCGWGTTLGLKVEIDVGDLYEQSSLIKGDQGFQGAQGVQGDQGAQGAQGNQGHQGNQGAGEQGVQGAQGSQGSQGIQGAGQQGTQGAQGFQGDNGDQGTQGTQGAQGAQGFQGDNGDQGTQGFQGSQGAQGIQGTQGNQGHQGNAGTGVNIKGNVATSGSLPSSGIQDGDGYLAIDTGHLWIFTDGDWVDVGLIRGPQGAQGTQGYQGTQGNQGAQGNQGFQGLQGTLGNQGERGNQWSWNTGYPATYSWTQIGDFYLRQDNWGVYSRSSGSWVLLGYIKGEQGFQGVQGTLGNQGFQGAQGGTGTQGAQGHTGTQGQQGFQGNQGQKGDKGDKGDQGATGAQGAQGTQGTQGVQGNQGAQGAAGTQGTTGAQGAQGTQGTQGVQGNQGAQGTTGAQGAQGAQGTQGATGAQGNQGDEGLLGIQGPQGVQGTQGNTGLQGPQGSAGATGNQGVQGTQGHQGNPGLQGPQGSAGANGFQGTQGYQGTQGNPGLQGPQGAQGNQGNNGTSVQILGSVTTSSNLPSSGNTNGDAYITENDGHLWVYTGIWVDVGLIRGPQGTTGTQGTQGTQGDQGDQGAQGTQGTQGVRGDELWTDAGSYIYRNTPVIVNKTTRNEAGNGSVFEAGSFYAFNNGVFMKNMPTNGAGETQILYYNPTTGKLAVGAAPVTSLWTDAGAHTYLTATGDNVSIGKSTNNYNKRLEVQGDCEASGTWVASNFILPSQRDLKKNIEPIGDVEFIDKIEFRKFVFKDDETERIRYGVIIDEIENIAPHFVYDGKTVSYIDLLIAKVARIEQRLKAFENGSKSS